MVYTEIDPFLRLQRNNTSTIFGKLGGTLTRYTFVETLDSEGNITARPETNAGTFTGDIQFLTEKDKEFLNIGVDEVGKAKLYTTFDVTLNEADEIEHNSQRWELIKKINSPDTDGGRDFQEWLLKRRN